MSIASRPRSEPISTSSITGKPPVIGSRVAGRYRVVALLHDDGSDHARVAVDERNEAGRRLVLLETLRREQRLSSAAIEAFTRDARVRERMNHPNIVQTHELVEHEGLPVLVTEYVEGESLATLLALAYGLPEFSLEVRLTILAQALRGLAYIHELDALAAAPSRLVHANVSPHDIVVGYDGSVKLWGYGSAAGAARGRSNAALGPANLEYLAPERLHASMQPSSDVFSAGILLWELVALQRFWNRLPEYEVRRRLLAFDIPDLSRLKPAVAGELGRICRQALAPDPGRRYASAVELAAELERFLVERSALAAPASIAHSMQRGCGALQQEARRALERATAGGQRRESLTDAGIWQVLTRERPLQRPTIAAWAAGTLAALLLAVAGLRMKSAAPDARDVQPSSLEPVSLEPASREARSHEARSHEARSHEAAPVDALPRSQASRVGERSPLESPEHGSSSTTIQTLLPDPQPPRRVPASAKLSLEGSEAVRERRRSREAEVRSRRARRSAESKPVHAPGDAAMAPAESSPLTIRLER